MGCRTENGMGYDVGLDEMWDGYGLGYVAWDGTVWGEMGWDDIRDEMGWDGM